MKIGILGGTFNPIHTGHTVCAANVMEQFGLDKIIFIPSRTPVHKELAGNIDLQHRINMIELAIKNNSNFELSKIEVLRKEASYSVITVDDLKKQNPESEFYFILGADSFNTLKSWKEAEKFVQMVSFIVLMRNGETVDKSILDWVKKAYIAKNNKIDVSSTQIRDLIKKNKSINGLVCEEVEEYIRKKMLYA